MARHSRRACSRCGHRLFNSWSAEEISRPEGILLLALNRHAARACGVSRKDQGPDLVAPFEAGEQEMRDVLNEERARLFGLMAAFGVHKDTIRNGDFLKEYWRADAPKAPGECAA